ncbi:MAG: caspase family protein [Roseibium sp.]|uniref:caspase family protein n=1 Tax=Roseibium sp. TaxID=1936156 RepID=UPI002601EF75|nr:caspase family protein [Roseibium sp.]MCV0424486.1 caspase family protein [Roseibium sp.]
MKRCVLTVLFLTLSILGTVSAALSDQQRTALVIGNADYAFAPLANPVNDAVAMAKALDEAGFNVILQTDVSRQGMKAALRAFGEKLSADNSIGMFYFAGHGIQIKGENFLLPLGAEFPDEETVKTQAVAVSEAVDLMTTSHDGLNIIVLDACRNNPLTGNSKGLSRIDSSARLFVSYSTSPGAVALDGSGVNSPYTKHLATSIKTPALSLEETFKRTLKGVYQDTGGEQTPWISSTFFGDFKFIAGDASGTLDKPVRVAATSSIGKALAESLARNGPARRISGVYRVAGSNPDGSGYSGMLSITPEGRKVHLTWWIGDDVFTGVGEFAGRMLVVNWGDKHPVVYTFDGEKALDGEWADGSASERLTLFSRATQNNLSLLEGTYSSAGRNPDGSTYTGTVDISRQGRKFTLVWQVGADSYRGDGVLEGNVLTVDWGDTTPVVYALTGDGTLQGLWSGGRGSENLQFVDGR